MGWAWAWLDGLRWGVSGGVGLWCGWLAWAWAWGWVRRLGGFGSLGGLEVSCCIYTPGGQRPRRT